MSNETAFVKREAARWLGFTSLWFGFALGTAWGSYWLVSALSALFGAYGWYKTRDYQAYRELRP